VGVTCTLVVSIDVKEQFRREYPVKKIAALISVGLLIPFIQLAAQNTNKALADT